MNKSSLLSPIIVKQYLDVQNAGDVASSVIVAHVTSRQVEISRPPQGFARLRHPLRALIQQRHWGMLKASKKSTNLIAIGSIMHWTEGNSIIWGTGFKDAYIDIRVKPRAVLAVRGYLTGARLRKLGVDCPEVFGDPGIFLPQIYLKQTAKYALGIVPHYLDQNDPFIKRAKANGAQIIDVKAPLPEFANMLSSCEKILSSSLHGVIFAHAYGIPAAWIAISDKIRGNGFKYYDYYSSIGMRQEDVPILNVNEKLETLAEHCHLPVSSIDKSALRTALIEGLEKWGLPK